MGKRVKIVLASVALALVGVIGWQVAKPSEPEPVYQGKRLSELVKADWRLDSSGRLVVVVDQPEVMEAVDQIGTNAIPTLLRWMAARNSALKLGLMNVILRLPIIKVQFIPASAWNFAAYRSFQVLGTNAQAAVPGLIQIGSENRPSRLLVARSLGLIGPPADAAVPPLVSWATRESNWRTRAVSIQSLGEIHARPEKVIPVLLNSLQDTNQQI